MPYKNIEDRRKSGKKASKVYYWKNREKRLAASREYYKSYYEKNRDEKLVYKREHYKKNRESILEKLRQKYVPSSRILKTEEENLERDREWREKNRDKRNTYMREWTRKNAERLKPIKQDRYKNKLTLSERFYRLKYGAESREHLVSITLEEFSEIVAVPCSYCGETEKRRGIDRINNAQGYTKENSASCCKLCNYMKRSTPVEDFLSHIKKINHHSNNHLRPKQRGKGIG